MPKSPFRRQLKKAKRGGLRLTVDRAEQQHKIHREEPDILWIMGWSYLPGADNAAFQRKIVLQRTDGAGYLARPADWHRTDVEEILPAEKHVGLAGFVLRLRKEEMQPGEYRVGMIATNEAGVQEEKTADYIAWSDSKLIIS